MSNESPEKTETPNQDPPNSRKQSLLFLAKFLILAAILLIGYRYAINTTPNIRYLYAIASQTSYALDILGYKSDLEPSRRQYPPGKLRADLVEWGIMPPDSITNTSPLTPREFWLHNAHQEIQRGPGLLDHGPTIRFTASQGLASRRTELTQKLKEIRRDKPSVSEVMNAQAQLNKIDQEIAGLSTSPDANQKINDRTFDFRIVPDCGAIPSLAIYLAAVLAFPVPWRKRALGALAGFATLYTINITRLVILAFVGAYDASPDKKVFTFIHEYVWQSIFLLFVVAVWLAWIELIVKPKKADAS